MKKTKRISLKIIAILIAMISIGLVFLYKASYAEENYPDSFKASFVFNTYEPQEYPMMESPPIKTVINGKATEIFCCEPGRRLTSGMYTYNREEIRNLSDKIACAIGSLSTMQGKVTEDYRYKQAIIWGDYGKGGLSENGILKIDLSDDVQKNEVSPLKRVGGGDLGTGKTVWKQAQDLVNKAKNYKKDATFEFVNTTPTLKVNDNGTYTIGPFRINYTKDDWSKITSIYLQDNNGNKHNVDIAASNVPVNKNFYVTVNKNDLQNATTVKLVAEYSHEYYTGTYARYVPEGKNSHQELIMCDVQHETQKQTKDFGEVVLTIDLKGRVFLDEQEGKDLEPDGMDQDKQDPGMANIPVWLVNADNQEVIAETKTDANGYYEFKDVSAAGNYYVRFQYDGQLYEPTTYNYKKAKVVERSYATEGNAKRQEFNNKFAEITNQTDISAANRQIYAYTGWDGLNGLKIYNVNTPEEERDNINLGLLEREKANLVLNKDLWEVNVSINQKSQTYIYNSRNDEDMEIALRGTDLKPYERKLYKEDVSYEGANPLSVQVTYRLRLYNASGYINTEVTNLIDYYDTIYTPIASYTDPSNKEGTAVTWNTEGTISANGYTYNKMTTSGYASGSFSSGDSRYVYLDYQVNADSIKDLLNTNEKTAENYAEIGAYKTYYVDTRLDLNKELDPNDSQARVMHEAGAPAGLIDINSTPGNFNPTDPAVYEFVHVTSKSDEYNNLSTEEKAKRSQEYFEDDADTAPSLRLTLYDDPRRLSGNVWDDITALDGDGIRKGDGVLGEEETGINKVKVQLIEVPNYNADNPDSTTASQEQRTVHHVVEEKSVEEDGYYEFSGYIPGDYYIRFTYGDREALTEYSAMYNGQDYKSTVYDAGSHTEEYWYAQNVENRNSDATDNLARREVVNGYSKDLNNYKANVLNKQNIDELADNTWMYADTAKMVMEVEYARKTTNYNEESLYNVVNVDFGLAERPRSELTADKKVSHVKLYTTDGQIVFDTSAKVSNLAWIPGQYIQGTVDNSLLHGATLELTYNMTIANTGEKDYQDNNFYQTYQIPAESTMVTTRPTEVLDYIANNLNFDNTLAENSGWEVVPVANLQLGSTDSLVNDSIDLSQQKTIVRANNSNELVTKALKPGESSSATMKLTQQLTSGGEDDDLTYNNYIEIVSSHNDNGRRSYNDDPTTGLTVVSIPGDFAPLVPEFTQPDTAKSEEVVILPPFGNENQAIYYIIGGTLIGIIILGVGIYFIKKKIVDR